MRDTVDFSAAKRIDLNQLRILVRRKDHGSPVVNAATELLDKLVSGASISEIEVSVERNAELSLRVVCVAGSAAFGGHEIRSIRHAIELLGSEQLQSILATIVGFSSSSKRNLIQGISKERFQRRSLLLAMLSSVLAGRLNIGNVSSHYMAGLLQEAGYIATAKFMPEKLEQVVAVCQRTEVADIMEIERYYLGFNHAEAGQVIGEEYKFKGEICQAIGCHHSPATSQGEMQEYADLAHLTSWLADELGYTVFNGYPRHDLDKYAAQRLGVKAEHFEPIPDSVKAASDLAYESMASV